MDENNGQTTKSEFKGFKLESNRLPTKTSMENREVNPAQEAEYICNLVKKTTHYTVNEILARPGGSITILQQTDSKSNIFF